MNRGVVEKNKDIICNSLTFELYKFKKTNVIAAHVVMEIGPARKLYAQKLVMLMVILTTQHSTRNDSTLWADTSTI
jgi:hypothetical protein